MTEKIGYASTLLTLLSLVLFSGCTFYGQNDAARLTRDQLVLLEQQIRDSYVRSHATFQRLDDAAVQDLRLKRVATIYREVLAVHADLVNNIESQAGNRSESASYRELARSFRANLSGRERIQDAYQRIARDLMKQTGTYHALNPIAPAANSILIPPYYRALQSSADKHTVVDGLRALNF